MAGPIESPAWRTRGKTIAQLIRELQSFVDQGLEVRMSADDGVTTRAISLVAKIDGACVLMNSEAPAEAGSVAPVGS